jgi:hypothetical protein
MSESDELCHFIEAYHRSLMKLQGVPVGQTSPSISVNSTKIANIINDSKDDNKSFLLMNLNQANLFKKTANLITHIYINSPIKNNIIKKFRTATTSNSNHSSFLVKLVDIPNHQNAVIAVAYSLYSLNKSFNKKLKLSCHSFAELIQTLCLSVITIELNNASEKDYQHLTQLTLLLSLLLEQIAYKTNSHEEDPHCDSLLNILPA